MQETDEYWYAYPISYRIARSIIITAFAFDDGRYEFNGFLEPAKRIKEITKEYLDKLSGKNTEWSGVFYFIECIWPSVVIEFGAILKKSNPIRITNVSNSGTVELKCEIIGDTIIIQKTSVSTNLA